jgi:hypothetical protein
MFEFTLTNVRLLTVLIDTHSNKNLVLYSLLILRILIAIMIVSTWNFSFLPVINRPFPKTAYQNSKEEDFFCLLIFNKREQ